MPTLPKMEVEWAHITLLRNCGVVCSAVSFPSDTALLPAADSNRAAP